MKLFQSLCMGLFALALPFAVQAQDVATALRTMNQVLSTAEAFHTEMDIRVFSGPDATDVLQAQTSAVSKQGTSFRYAHNGMSVLYTDNAIVAVNSAAKEIVYTAHDGSAPGDLSPVLPNLDSLLAVADSAVFSGSSAVGEHYIIYDRSAVITETHVFLNAETHLLERMIYHYHPRIYPMVSHVEIVFSNTSLNPTFPRGTFSEKQFITNRKQPTLKDAYADYSLTINIADDED